MKKYVVLHENTTSYDTTEEAIEEAKRNLSRYTAGAKMYIFETAFCVEKGNVPFLVEDLTGQDEDFIDIKAEGVTDVDMPVIEGIKLDEVSAESPLSSSLSGTGETAAAPAAPDGEKTLVDLPSDLQPATASVDLAAQPQPEIRQTVPAPSYPWSQPGAYYGW